MRGHYSRSACKPFAADNTRGASRSVTAFSRTLEMDQIFRACPRDCLVVAPSSPYIRVNPYLKDEAAASSHLWQQPKARGPSDVVPARPPGSCCPISKPEIHNKRANAVIPAIRCPREAARHHGQEDSTSPHAGQDHPCQDGITRYSGPGKGAHPLSRRAGQGNRGNRLSMPSDTSAGAAA